MKIVVNKCYGGFSVSHAGMIRYAKLAGIKLYPEGKPPKDKHAFNKVTYWTVPKDKRLKCKEGKAWSDMTLAKRVEYNRKYDEQTIGIRDFKRDDPYLVKMVEQLGEESWGPCAELAITETPDDVSWEIEEYDGREWVAEKHRTW